MKKILYLSVLVFLFSSCEKLLIEEPKNQIGTEFFYNDADDALMALNAAYARLKSGSGYYSQQFLSNVFASSDQGQSSWKHGEYFKGILSSTNPTLPNTWSEIYEAIRDANNVIYNVNDIEMNVELKNRIVGEARFLRALHYLNLVRTFGEVPLRLLPVQPGEEGGLPVSSRKEIYQAIIDDLKFASENCWGRLEVREAYSNDLGRVTNASADALLARTYLHIASSSRTAVEGNLGNKFFEVYGNDYMAYYDSCATYSTKAIEAQGYELVTNLESWVKLFASDNGNNPEMMFEIQGSNITGEGTAVSNLFCPRNAGLSGGGWGGTNKLLPGFTKSNVDITDPRFDNSIIHEYVVGNTRYEILPDRNGYAKYDVNTGNKKGSLFVIYSSKYIDSDATTEYTSQQNWHVIRLADVYLMRAEALAEINQNPAFANEDINILRNRVGHLESYDGSLFTMEEFREQILRERAAELSVEGNRFFDLIRLGKYEEKVNLAFDPKGQGVQQGIRGPEDYFWPLPITEVAANENID